MPSGAQGVPARVDEELWMGAERKIGHPISLGAPARNLKAYAGPSEPVRTK
jgi:hypothetical protein